MSSDYNCGNAGCSLCDNPPKEKTVPSRIVLGLQNTRTAERIAEDNKSRVVRDKLNKASFDLSAVTSFLGDEQPYASLYVSDGDSTGSSGSPNAVGVKLSLAEVEQIEDVAYQVRKQLLKATEQKVTRARDKTPAPGFITYAAF